MSIYGTTFSVGDPEEDDTPGVVLIRDGGENHYPTPERNRIGSIDGAAIPSWCVPGHQENYGWRHGYRAPGPWYRLSGCSWRNEPGLGAKLWCDQEYLLDENAARALRDDLTRWLDLPKTRPIENPNE